MQKQRMTDCMHLSNRQEFIALFYEEAGNIKKYLQSFIDYFHYSNFLELIIKPKKKALA